MTELPEYTTLALLAALAMVVVELKFLRTGVFKLKAYWIAMAIIGFFMVLTDGWLTKLSAPVVIYNEAESTGIRFPWDIPVEDFAFGFALVTLGITMWLRSDL